MIFILISTNHIGYDKQKPPSPPPKPPHGSHCWKNDLPLFEYVRNITRMDFYSQVNRKPLLAPNASGWTTKVYIAGALSRRLLALQVRDD
jgi:hypothetical protein